MATKLAWNERPEWRALIDKAVRMDSMFQSSEKVRDILVQMGNKGFDGAQMDKYLMDLQMWRGNYLRFIYDLRETSHDLHDGELMKKIFEKQFGLFDQKKLTEYTSYFQKFAIGWDKHRAHFAKIDPVLATHRVVIDALARMEINWWEYAQADFDVKAKHALAVYLADLIEQSKKGGWNLLCDECHSATVPLPRLNGLYKSFHNGLAYECLEGGKSHFHQAAWKQVAAGLTSGYLREAHYEQHAREESQRYLDQWQSHYGKLPLDATPAERSLSHSQTPV